MKFISYAGRGGVVGGGRYTGVFGGGIWALVKGWVFEHCIT